MPQRSFSRDQLFLLPVDVEEFVPADHPARFVAAFVEGLDRAACATMGIDLDGAVRGAPSYHPRALLCAWLYGFMTGIRSARKLEVACREQLPSLWLTGCQQPDHNTLWRFYRDHRQGMRQLLKRTVRTAVAVGLVDLAVQAVDGTKLAGNAAKDRTYDRDRLEKLLVRTEAAIEVLEAQNGSDGEAVAARLPVALQRAEALREQVKAAQARLEAEEGRTHVNLTDGDAVYVKSRQGIVAGYNAQAAVVGVAAQPGQAGGLLIAAAEVTQAANDVGQLVAMVETAEETLGEQAAVTVADSGYHSGANLAACAARGVSVLMPDGQEEAMAQPYHKVHFIYEAETDSYRCPEGHQLPYRGDKEREGRERVRVYGGLGAICRRCAAFGTCTRDRRQGRRVEVGPYEAVLQHNRAVMATPEAQALYARRKELVEPSFGILKEVQGARRFLLRGLANVRAEWSLLATAFNLRTLFRVWRQRLSDVSIRLATGGC